LNALCEENEEIYGEAIKKMNKENVPFTQTGKRQGNDDKKEKRSELD
jgi:hypothetical protein